MTVTIVNHYCPNCPCQRCREIREREEKPDRVLHWDEIQQPPYTKFPVREGR